MKIKKIIKISLLVIILILLFNTVSNANQLTYKSNESALKIADIDISKEQLGGIYGNQGNTYNEVGAKIIGLVQYLCYGAAVIVLIYKGVQFMNKAPEAKAEAKKELVSYAIGAFILFGIGTMIKIISNIALNNLF